MITCRECGAQADAAVGYCPHCGSRLPYSGTGRKRFIRLLFTCCLTLVIISLLKNSDGIREAFREWRAPFISENSNYEEEESAPDEEYREERWTEQVGRLLEEDKLNSALEVIDEQIAANSSNTRLYEVAGTILTEYGYLQEAANVWLAGMIQTGERQFAVLLRENVRPAHLAVADELAGYIADVFGKPLEEVSWEELGQIRRLHVTDSSTESAPAAESQAEENGGIAAELVFDSYEAAWGAPELVLLHALEQLQWDSRASLDVRALTAASGLQHLRLQSFGNSDLQVLAELEELTSLTLGSTSLDSLDGITRMKRLRSLELGRASVTKLDLLAELPGLERLALTDSHQLASADELARLNGLRELVLEGGELLEMQALAGLQHLESLTVRRSAIKDISFVAELSALRSLTLDSNNELTNLRPLGGLHGLEKLHLNTGVINSLDELAQLKNLQSLYLNGLRDLQPLSSLQQLQTLVLKGASGYGDLQPLASLGKLESLTLDDASIDSNQLGILLSLSSLKRLQLIKAGIYDPMGGIAALSNLEELSIQSSMIQLSLSALSSLGKLEKLAIKDSKLIHNVTIKRQGPVTQLYYDLLDWDKELANWNAPPQLSRLELTGSGLTQLDFAAKLPQLTELNLAGNSITHLEPLKQLTQLRKVNLLGNPILDAAAAQEMGMTDILLSP